MLDSLDTAIYGAWHAALFSKGDKLPDLGEILGRMRQRKKRTPQATLDQFDTWAIQVKAAQAVAVEAAAKGASQ